MLGVLTAIIAGAASIWNYAVLSNTVLQVIFTILSLFSLFAYRGRKTQANYNHDGTKIFTLGFALCLLSALGSLSILLVFIFHLG